MDQTPLFLLVVAAAGGILAVIVILLRQSRERHEAEREDPLGTSTEGMKVCPRCGGQNLWTEATCIYCRARLRG